MPCQTRWLTSILNICMISMDPPPGGMGYSEPAEGDLSEAKVDALKRLSYIEGHLSGIRKMLEEDKYCVDVLKQTYAVRRAIEKMESILLEWHLHSCVVEGIKEGREDEVVGELTDLYLLANR